MNPVIGIIPVTKEQFPNMYTILSSEMFDSEHLSVAEQHEKALLILNKYRMNCMVFPMLCQPGTIKKIITVTTACGYFLPWSGFISSAAKAVSLIMSVELFSGAVIGMMHKDKLQANIGRGTMDSQVSEIVLQTITGRSIVGCCSMAALSLISMALPFSGMNFAIAKILSAIPGAAYFSEMLNTMTSSEKADNFLRGMHRKISAADSEIEILRSELNRTSFSVLKIVPAN